MKSSYLTVLRRGLSRGSLLRGPDAPEVQLHQRVALSPGAGSSSNQFDLLLGRHYPRFRPQVGTNHCHQLLKLSSVLNKVWLFREYS